VWTSGTGTAPACKASHSSGFEGEGPGFKAVRLWAKKAAFQVNPTFTGLFNRVFHYPPQFFLAGRKNFRSNNNQNMNYLAMN